MAIVNYFADNFADPWPEQATALGEVVRPFIFTIPNGGDGVAFGAGDTISLTVLPGIDGIYFTEFDLEFGTMSGTKFELGDSTAVARFIASNGINPSAGGRVYSLDAAIVGSLPCTYNPNGAAAGGGNDALILTCTTATPEGTVTGVIFGWVRYSRYGTGPLIFGNEPS